MTRSRSSPAVPTKRTRPPHELSRQPHYSSELRMSLNG
jgi:hypothetical protein